MNKYTVIIPVYGALESVERCLDSVRRNAPHDVPVLVIDDCSKDANVIRRLHSRFLEGGIAVKYHTHNMGFVKTANEGMRMAVELGTDPILLNSDTEVPPRWIERLDAARASNPKCASVSPLSNKCTQYSVPNQWDGELQKGVSVEEMDRIVEETSSKSYPSVVTNVGFCMLLTREAIEEVGLFDTKWGNGYGEETDWCQKARAKGFKCVLADDLFVYHKHRASFGPKAESCWQENSDKFEELYPDFRDQLDAENLNHPLTEHRFRIADRLRPRTRQKKTKVMYVCHNWGKLGGLEIFQNRLVQELAKSLEITVVHPRRGDMVEASTIVQHENGALQIAMSKRLVQSKVDLSIFPFQFDASHVERWFEQCLDALRPDVVHFQHLGGFGTFNLPKIAKRKECRVVLSVHDDYYLCPSYLVAGWSCGRDYAKNCEQCRNCVNEHMDVLVEGRVTEKLGPMLTERHGKLIDMMTRTDRVVFPSRSIRNRFRTQFPIAEGRTMVIPHGVPRYPYIATHKPSEKIRVAWVGGLLNEKGWATFAKVCRQLKGDERFEFSALGERHEQADITGLSHVRFHGRYKSEDLPQLMQRVDIAVPAVARKESYCLVADECLAAGCPTVVPNVPALRERGFVCSYEWGNAAHLMEWLETTHVRDLTRVHVANPQTLEQCALDYLELYEELLA